MGSGLFHYEDTFRPAAGLPSTQSVCHASRAGMKVHGAACQVAAKRDTTPGSGAGRSSTVAIDAAA